ncbi:hypothetical protein OTB19_29915 [Streptomyces sp. H27-H5]|nr:hypothetical protein [Streptomyces sp. H27-H5]MCY0961090.1 hypothetical protein [Streptomyces sp. H27-H5]
MPLDDLHGGDVDDHPVRAGLHHRGGEIVLKQHHRLVVQIGLDGHQQHLSDPQDRNLLAHRPPARGAVREKETPERRSACRRASARVALVTMSPKSMPRAPIVCAIRLQRFLEREHADGGLGGTEPLPGPGSATTP